MTLEEAKEQGFKTHAYDNGDWAYKESDGNVHLFRDGVELTKGVVAKWCYSYLSGDWAYRDTDGNAHLFRDGVELTKGVETKNCLSFDNDDWAYQDANGNEHLFRDGVELTKGVVAKNCYSHYNGDWGYQGTNGNLYHFTKDERIEMKTSKAEPDTQYKTIVKTKEDEVIEDLTHTLVSAQEYFDIDIMPEIVAIAIKIGESKAK